MHSREDDRVKRAFPVKSFHYLQIKKTMVVQGKGSIFISFNGTVHIWESFIVLSATLPPESLQRKPWTDTAPPSNLRFLEIASFLMYPQRKGDPNGPCLSLSVPSFLRNLIGRWPQVLGSVPEWWQLRPTQREQKLSKGIRQEIIVTCFNLDQKCLQKPVCWRIVLYPGAICSGRV